MKKVHAFTAGEDERTLYHTARSAREAEFDRLWLAVHEKMGSLNTENGYVMLAKSIAVNLRGGIYPTAGDALLAAADYFREHRSVLTGAELDPADTSSG